MLEKVLNSTWFLLFGLFISTVLAFNAVLLAFHLINQPSSILFIIGGFIFLLTIISYGFWTIMIVRQIIKIIKNKLNKD